MSVFRVDISVGNKERSRWRELSAVVDTETFMSAVPASVLRHLGVAPETKEIGQLADGSEKEVDVAYTWLRLNEREGMAYFVFDEEESQPRLGRVAINSLLLEVDQTQSKLVPMTKLLL